MPNILDQNLAELALKRSPHPNPAMKAFVALVSAMSRNGHSCLDLSRLDDIRLPETDAAEQEAIANLALSEFPAAAFQDHPLLVYNAPRLSLKHLADKEHAVGAGLLRLAQERLSPSKAALDKLAELFPSGALKKYPERADTQKVAAFAALLSRLTVITGGPGTGKTTTVRRLIAVLRAETPGLRIALAAPTGKAVNRLNQSLKQDSLQASTLHRLLEFMPEKGFRRNATRPLAADLVVIDEVSMVGLDLFYALIQALPPECRLILLGDKDQLEAVETGSVLADLAASAAPLNHFSQEFINANPHPELLRLAENDHPLHDRVVSLEYTYRSEDAPELAAAAVEINSGRVPSLPSCDPVEWLQRHRADFLPVGQPSLNEVERLLGKARILAAVNQGSLGVEGLNILACQALFHRQPSQVFAGKQIIVTANSYQDGLYNGDTGVMLPDDNGELRAWFPGPDGLRSFTPAFLPPHQCAFAITVHKSQGSEFGDILFVFPERDNRVLSRPLLYTAVTRAKHQAMLHDPAHLLDSVVGRINQPHTGLFSLMRST